MGSNIDGDGPAGLSGPGGLLAAQIVENARCISAEDLRRPASD